MSGYFAQLQGLDVITMKEVVNKTDSYQQRMHVIINSYVPRLTTIFHLFERMQVM